VKLRKTKRARVISIIAAALLPVILDGAPAHASTGHEASSALAQRGRLAAQDGTQHRGVYDATLFATWGTVTNGNSSVTAAEYRKELTGGHAGSTNAAEAPAFHITSR
jgi:hypothetical protein